MNLQVKERFKSMVEQAIGHTINEATLNGPTFSGFNKLILNVEETESYLFLLEKYNVKDDGSEIETLDEIFAELVDGRTLTCGPSLHCQQFRNYPFKLLTKQWQDEYGNHLIMCVMGNNGMSEPSIFDEDILASKLIRTN